LHILIFVDKRASWEPIKSLYNNDKMYNKTRVSKLTDSHIFPNNFEKMKGKYAAQMLRATVAAAMSLSIRFRFLPASASGTTEFLERIDKLFDLFNSSTTSTANKYNRAFKGLDYQMDFLKECYQFFDNVEVMNHQKRDITS
jgi:leucyl-tRNA synthetase